MEQTHGEPLIVHSDKTINQNYRYLRFAYNIASGDKRAMRHQIKELRKKAGLTQAEAAEAAGISQAYYSDIENGRRQLNEHRADGLAKAFGCHPFDLYAHSDEEAHLLSNLKVMNDDDRQSIFTLAERLARRDRGGETP